MNYALFLTFFHKFAQEQFIVCGAFHFGHHTFIQSDTYLPLQIDFMSKLKRRIEKETPAFLPRKFSFVECRLRYITEQNII